MSTLERETGPALGAEPLDLKRLSHINEPSMDLIIDLRLKRTQDHACCEPVTSACLAHAGGIPGDGRVSAASLATYETLLAQAGTYQGIGS